MTGRELIIYILANKLEDEQIFQDGHVVGFLTVEELAVKLQVGPSTVKAWIDHGSLNYVKCGDTIYIPNDFKTEFVTKITRGYTWAV